ncbi:F-box/kelch-repeat protein At3g23880-like [Euphorbia lathyris]|uniref:F-box/kelch-repeat protein At3g23880-like n=1 Tax=Euphorbia lathyris TaxID=212925 RepID=UPI003313F638
MEEGGRDTEKAEVMELLEEILIEILLRLPLKSLLKFKTVCKSWRSIINSPKFIKEHLNHAHATHYNQHKDFLGLLIPSWDASSRCVMYKEMSDDIVHAKQFDFPYQLPASPHERIPVRVCNFCNGLICFNMFGRGILLWNPSFPLEYKIIRNSQLDIGFTLMGYDSSTDDYKIVSIPSYSSNERFARRCFFVEVFSLKSSSWRKKEISKNFFTYNICQLTGIYTRNHLHWTATRNFDENDVTELIVYFDLVEERLDHVILPTSYNDWTLLIYKECFGIVGANSEGQGELWVLQDYCGIKSSWNKIFKIAPPGIGVPYHSCFTRTGEILVHNGDLGLRFYDIKDGRFKNVVIQGDNITNENAFYASPYVESLVSLRLCL